MKHAVLTGTLVVLMLVLGSLAGRGQTLDIASGIQTYTALTNTTVNMSGNCELWLTASNAPLSGCTISLNSPDAWLFLPNVLPSVVTSNYLGQVYVNGANAVAGGNVRVVEYAMGTVVIPQPPNFQPLQVFSGPQFTGASQQLGQYTYYEGAGLGAMDAEISSFKLKRGYTAVVAQNPDGSGASRCYIAQDGDLEVSVLPSQLDHRIRFIYVTPWRWTCKKGIAGNPGIPLLNVRWWYDWNIDQSSTPDLEYEAIRQNASWPGITGQNWQAMGINTLLGFNEPDNPLQANMSVASAIAEWPLLLSSGLRVGSPAVTDGGRSSWLYPFIQQADADSLRVDFIAVHYYQWHNPADPAGCASQMYNFLLDIWNHTHRPIWVTEWNNGANWTDSSSTPPPTYAQQQADIAAMIQMLDSTPFVERYALYNWVEDVRSVVNTNGVLTAAGVTYRDEVSPVGYRQEMPDNGTRSLAQFLFETNVLDSSGYGNNGLAVGDPTYAVSPNGQAVVLDGTNNYIQLPENIASSNSFSFAAWVYWNGGPPWQRIFDFGDDTSHYLFLTPDSGSGTLRFAISTSGNGGEQRLDAAPLAPDTWVHVAVTLAGGTARLYTNGVLAASSSSFTLSPATIAPMFNYLGKSQFPADPLFRGKIGDVLITDYALTASQVASLMTDSPPQFATNFIAVGSGTQGQYFSGSIAGMATGNGTLTYRKAGGPAWLTVAPDGTLTGTPTLEDSGTNYFTVRATDAAGASGFTVVTVVLPNVLGDGVWTSDANGNWSDTSKWSNGFPANGAGYAADFSTVNITADRTVTVDAPRTIGALKFGDPSGAHNWTLTGSAITLDNGAGVVPDVSVNQGAATLALPLVAPIGLQKIGSGTLVLGGSNSISGTVYIDTASTTTSEGIVRIANPGALANVGNIQIRDNNGGSSTLQLDGSLGNITLPASIALNGRNVNVAAIENLSGNNTLAGEISINVGGGYYIFQSDAGLLNLDGITSAAAGTRTLTFQGSGNINVTGSIANGSAILNLIKNGSGTMTLPGTNTYTGTTIVNGGALLVDGSIGTNSVTITSGGTLGGIGTVNGPVTIQAGGTLAPGTEGVGAMTLTTPPSLNGNTLMKLDLSTPQTSDRLNINGILTYGGSLTVVNIGPALQAGNSFQLFAAPGYSGSFSATYLPALAAGLSWSFDPTTGVLSVIGGNIPLTPIGLTATGGASQVVLKWSASSGASSYNVKRATTSGGPYTTVGSTTTTNYTDSGLVNGTTYYYVVSAVNSAGESPNSAQTSATPKAEMNVPNFGFETPVTSSYIYAPGGASWTFTGSSPNGSGVTANNSGFTAGNAPAPQGNQVAFLQGIASIAQSLSGFVSGTAYTVKFFASQRQNKSGGQAGQTFNLQLNNTVIGSFEPAQSVSGYEEYQTNFVASASTYTMSFVGTDLHGGDNTVFLDDVRLRAIARPQFSSFTRLANGNLQFEGSGTAGIRYELDATTNLASPVNWVFVTNAVAGTNGLFQMVDSQTANFPRRFYRIRVSP